MAQPARGEKLTTSTCATLDVPTACPRRRRPTGWQRTGRFARWLVLVEPSRHRRLPESQMTVRVLMEMADDEAAVHVFVVHREGRIGRAYRAGDAFP